jgi:proline dehydrogenase
MSIARNILLRTSHSQWLGRQMSRRAFARRAVRRFMPGEQLTDALGAAATLTPSKIGTIITRLGETLTGETNTAAVRDHYLAAFNEIAGRKLPTQISIKPTQLGLDSSVEVCVRELRVLASQAESLGNFLWIDMEDSSYVDRTLDVFEKLRADYANIGLALQSCLFRTPKDLERLMPLKPVIRLVKGAYAEPASVAFPAKRDVDAAFVSLAETMLVAATTGGALPIFGTHDMTIVNRLIAKAAELRVDTKQYGIHMLYGIRSQEQRTLAAAGQSVRCLISYGENWFPWYMRRLAERPANVWFVVKSMFA